MAELHLFDFDGTLFRSPEMPDWWDGKFWWFDQQSLDEPCVPEQPGGDWWISSTVSQAKKSIADPDVWAVLMTGRADRKFRWRVPELLKQKGLNFDEVHLSPAKGETGYFKVNRLKAILKRYMQSPGITRVRMWDDNVKNLGLFKGVVEALGIEAEVNPVKVPAHAPLCGPESVQRVASRYLVGMPVRTLREVRVLSYWLKPSRDGWLVGGTLQVAHDANTSHERDVSTDQKKLARLLSQDGAKVTVQRPVRQGGEIQGDVDFRIDIRRDIHGEWQVGRGNRKLRKPPGRRQPPKNQREEKAEATRLFRSWLARLLEDLGLTVVDRRPQRVAGAIGPYEDSVIDGIKVTQVRVDNRRSGASIRGNKLLVKWGQDTNWWSDRQKQTQLMKWVRWAKRKLGQKAERIEQKKEWKRTRVDGYSVYDLEGKELVAGVLAKVERDVRPILREFDLSYRTMKESVAEGSLGFNRGGRTIALNVRQKRDPMKLRKYSAVMRTMIHELAHLRHMNHGPGFKAFDAELLAYARANGIYRPG
jgi:hypothetical protein